MQCDCRASFIYGWELDKDVFQKWVTTDNTYPKEKCLDTKTWRITMKFRTVNIVEINHKDTQRYFLVLFRKYDEFDKSEFFDIAYNTFLVGDIQKLVNSITGSYGPCPSSYIVSE